MSYDKNARVGPMLRAAEAKCEAAKDEPKCASTIGKGNLRVECDLPAEHQGPHTGTPSASVKKCIGCDLEEPLEGGDHKGADGRMHECTAEKPREGE